MLGEYLFAKCDILGQKKLEGIFLSSLVVQALTESTTTYMFDKTITGCVLQKGQL